MLVPRILVPVDVKAAVMESSVKAPQYRRALEATVTCGSQQGAPARRLMLVPRILVPLDTKAGMVAGGGNMLQDDPTGPAPAVPRGSQPGVRTPRPTVM